MLVLIVLLIFGGEVIRGFTFCMLLGVIVGTYSSLFVAAPVVVDILQREKIKNASLATVDATTAAAKTKGVKA